LFALELLDAALAAYPARVSMMWRLTEPGASASSLTLNEGFKSGEVTLLAESAHAASASNAADTARLAATRFIYLSFSMLGEIPEQQG
jgi:hypothetical protein